MIALCLLGTANAVALAELNGQENDGLGRVRAKTRIGVEPSGATAKFDGQVPHWR